MENYKERINWVKESILRKVMSGYSHQCLSEYTQNILEKAVLEVMKENTGTEEQFEELLKAEYIVIGIYYEYRRCVKEITNLEILSYE